MLDDKRRVVGVRIPESELLCELVTALESPLLTTSIPNYLDFHFGYQVDQTYGHALDMILDLGEEVIPFETTILDLTGPDVVVVREGKGSIDILTEHR